MAEKKLIIKPHRYGGETAVVSMRLPKEMLAVIDRAAAETRSYLIRRKVKMRSALSVRGRLCVYGKRQMDTDRLQDGS